MGDFERTFGAADAADIIYNDASERSRKEERAVFVPPEGMSDIERELFAKLSEYTREMEHNYGVSPGCILMDWTLIKIIACLPDTMDTMKAIVGTQIDNLHEFVEAVREAKEKKYQLYVKARQEEHSKFANLKFDDSE